MGLVRGNILLLPGGGVEVEVEVGAAEESRIPARVGPIREGDQ